MAKLTDFYKTTHHLIEHGQVVNEHRPYLGMSQLGHGCARYLWYGFRWYHLDTTSKRMKRLWDRGHREEEQIMNILRAIGYEVDETQQHFEFALGHAQGHNDGTVLGVIEAAKARHLLEMKTIADKYYKQLIKKRLQKYSSVYYGQVQLYMHFLKLTRCLFIAVNKNDDSLYIERVRYDKGYAEDLVRKGEYIVLSEFPPERAYPSKTFFECNWCSAKEVCWSGKKPQRNCRTCTHSEPALEGNWSCTWAGNLVTIPEAIQRAGCKHYKVKEL